MRTKLILLAGSAVTVTAAAVAISAGSPDPGPSPRPAAKAAKVVDRSHVRPAAMRTLVVHRAAMPGASVAGMPMHAKLTSGAAPSRPMVGTVMSDSDCGPDATGLSHCRNVIRMPGGHKMVVRHPHRMSDVPCMTPGEKVRVTRAA